MNDATIAEEMTAHGEGWALSGPDYNHRAVDLLKAMSAFREDARHAISCLPDEGLVSALQQGANIGLDARALLDDMQRDEECDEFKAEAEGLRAQFTENDLPGSVRDLVGLLIAQRERYRDECAEWEQEAFLLAAGMIPTPATPSQNPMRPNSLRDLGEHLRYCAAKLKGEQTDD